MKTKISAFSLDRKFGIITATVSMPEKEFDFNINQGQFEDWHTGGTGLVEWCDDFYDPREADGHGQQAGTINIEEWWEDAAINDTAALQALTNFINRDEAARAAVITAERMDNVLNEIESTLGIKLKPYQRPCIGFHMISYGAAYHREVVACHKEKEVASV